eukprot:4624986-Karenia_brevis.AAC.1
MTTMTCTCGEKLTRRLFASQIECAGCGFLLPQRTIRYMCLKPECQFHVCNTCKEQAHADDREGGLGRDDTQLGEGMEGHKRGAHTPMSQRRPKKGREEKES